MPLNASCLDQAATEATKSGLLLLLLPLPLLLLLATALAESLTSGTRPCVCCGRHPSLPPTPSQKGAVEPCNRAAVGCLLAMGCSLLKAPTRLCWSGGHLRALKVQHRDHCLAARLAQRAMRVACFVHACVCRTCCTGPGVEFLDGSCSGTTGDAGPPYATTAGFWATSWLFLDGSAGVRISMTLGCSGGVVHLHVHGSAQSAHAATHSASPPARLCLAFHRHSPLFPSSI